ncbi:MAG: hypothetical protein MJ066_01485 [Clostridia bacterium]|nr:hypothetical protein [Clostridia bacterium]
MDIYKIISDLLLNEKNKSVITPLFELLKENSFDIKKTISNITPDKILPFVEQIISNGEKNPLSEDSGTFYKLEPINNFADKDIVNTLNNYLDS